MSEKKVFKLPVTWEMFGFVEIEADTLEEAIQIFKDTEEDLPLPDEATYVDGSFAMSDDEEEIALFN